MKLIIATHNRHKAEEIQAFFHSASLDVTCQNLQDIGFEDDILEDVLTFDGNALKKAKTVAKHVGAGTWVLADDSGLFVDALDGGPGIYSARHAHEHASDQENLQKLLNDLTIFPSKAHYHCSMVCMQHDDRVFTTQGQVHGEIIDSPKGTNGFGYDPIFFLPDLNKTMAQLSFEDKNTISHRTLALKEMAKLIKKHIL